ncbi:hypothetical protein BVY02_02420 [bacterium J17]|nr:hypothetical protein BVY02_02420 [bacterium J17]
MKFSIDKFVLLVILPLAMFTGVQSASAAPDGLRVGFVDLEKALSGSVVGKSAQKKYEKEVKAAQNKLDAKKKKLENLQSSFQKQSSSLSAAAKANKKEEIIALEKDLKRSYQDTQDQLRRKNAQVVRELLVKLRKVVNEVGKAESFTVILEKGSDSVLYADNSIDITDRVVKRFDANN